MPLVDTSDRTSISALSESLRIIEGSGGHILTPAFHRLEVTDGTGVTTEVGVIYSSILRWTAWAGDATLTDAMPFLDWLAAQGAAEPRAEYLSRRAAERQEGEASARAVQRWVDAMPDCLRPFWDADRWPENGVRHWPLDPLVNTIAKEFPTEDDRAAVLLIWLGLGSGPWSGFPSDDRPVDDELEPAERRLVRADIGTLDGQDAINAEWRVEGAAVLAWSLGLARLTGVDCGSKTDDLDLLYNPLIWTRLLLRDPDEIARYEALLYNLHWRVVHSQFSAGWYDLRRLLAGDDGPIDGVEPVRYANDDLAIGDGSFHTAPVDRRRPDGF